MNVLFYLCMLIFQQPLFSVNLSIPNVGLEAIKKFSVLDLRTLQLLMLQE